MPHGFENFSRGFFEENWTFLEKKPPLESVLIVGGAFLVGVAFMSFVSRAELGIIAQQFSLLWSIPQDRQEILRVFFKILATGIVFAAIALACLLAMSARYQQTEEEDRAVQLPARKPEQSSSLPQAPTSMVGYPQREAQKQTVLHATTVPALRYEEVSVGLQSPPQQRSLVQQLPITPLPQTTVLDSMLITTLMKQEQSSDQGSQSEQIIVAEAAQEQHQLAGQEVTDDRKGDGVPVYFTITLLKTITMTLHIPGIKKVYPITLDDLSGKALQLIAYIAWRQGAKVAHGDMRNDIFGNDELDQNQVQEALNTAKREVRRRVNDAIDLARSDFGENILPQDLDIFALAKKKYWLPAHCQVRDLAVIEEQHRIIDEAENSHRLVNAIPTDVYQACKTLIKAYTGDFIEDLLVQDPFSFDPPQDSWAREPFTLYRDYYLQAVLYCAEYERKAGDGAAAPTKQREHYSEAGRLFALGAMAACDSRVFDGMFSTKVFFSSKANRRHGAHVLLSEQLARRAIALYGRIGDTILAKRVYSTYADQMSYVSNKVWSPDPETLKDLDAAVQQTGAYRFSDDHISSPYDLSGSLPTTTESAT